MVRDYKLKLEGVKVSHTLGVPNNSIFVLRGKGIPNDSIFNSNIIKTIKQHLSFTCFFAHHSFSVTSYPQVLAFCPLTLAIKDKTSSPSRIHLAILSLAEAVE